MRIGNPLIGRWMAAVGVLTCVCPKAMPCRRFRNQSGGLPEPILPGDRDSVMERGIGLSEKAYTERDECGQPTTEEAWQEVGRQLQALGTSLASAVKVAWHDAENRQRAREVQAGLEDMANQIGQAIREGVASPEGQRAKGEAARVAGSIRSAAERTAQEVGPQLVAALRQASTELEKAINNSDQERKTNQR